MGRDNAISDEPINHNLISLGCFFPTRAFDESTGHGTRVLTVGDNPFTIDQNMNNAGGIPVWLVND
jgi:hypothetical protein